jgi:hypothetical protein
MIAGGGGGVHRADWKPPPQKKKGKPKRAYRKAKKESGAGDRSQTTLSLRSRLLPPSWIHMVVTLVMDEPSSSPATTVAWKLFVGYLPGKGCRTDAHVSRVPGGCTGWAEPTRTTFG